jgi:hypothetical protein
VVPIAAEIWWKFDEARLMVLEMQNRAPASDTNQEVLCIRKRAKAVSSN